jgi:TetR/AcrR family fatty acid metabolism transcriptional regulator
VRTKTTSQADKMLAAAARLFGTQRFHEVRMDDIAAEAGVGKGTLYRYFRDKDELYLVLLRHMSTQFMERLRAEVARHDTSRRRLEALAAAVIEYFDEQPHLLDLLQRAEVQRGSGPDHPWHHARGELFQLTQRLLEGRPGLDESPVQEPELATLMFLGGLRSVIRFGRRPRPRDLARRVVDLFLTGAAAGTSPFLT